jgi:hypothetical protein
MNNLSLSVFGLDDIKEYLNPDKISKSLAMGVGEAVLQLHSALRTSVFQRYDANNDLNKALVRNSGLAATGRGFIKDGLLYKDTRKNLANFAYNPKFTSLPTPLSDSSYWGNLNEPKVRKGLVHNVKVVRGIQVTVRGKHGYGGFVKRGKSSGKLFMLERTSSARFPIRIVSGLNLIDMALIRLAHDDTVKNALNNLENTIIERFIP